MDLGQKIRKKQLLAKSVRAAKPERDLEQLSACPSPGVMSVLRESAEVKMRVQLSIFNS